MLGKIITFLLKLKLKREPEFLATCISIDEHTSIHVIVEKIEGNIYKFGTRTERLEGNDERLAD